MKTKVGVNFHNRFDIVKNGEWVGFAENIVLDQMYNRLCSLMPFFVNIHFGTGAGTPTPGRTSLFTHLETKSAVTEEVIRAFPTGKWIGKIVLNPEEFNDVTLTEVGIAYSSTATHLVTHAMIKDSEGNPLSIPKTSIDVVVIYATVFATLSLPEGLDTIDFIGSSGGGLMEYLTGRNLLTSSDENKRTLCVGSVALVPLYIFASEPKFQIVPNVASKKVLLTLDRTPIDNNPSGGYPVTNALIGQPYGLNSLSHPVAPLCRLNFGERQINGEVIGVSNGSNRNFKTKWAPIVPDSLVLKGDGVVIPSSKYSVEYSKPLSAGHLLPYGWKLVSAVVNPDAQRQSMFEGYGFFSPSNGVSIGVERIYEIDNTTRAVGIGALHLTHPTNVQSYFDVKKFGESVWTRVLERTGSVSTTVALSADASFWNDVEYLKIGSVWTGSKTTSAVMVIGSFSPKVALSTYLPDFNIAFNEGEVPNENVTITADYSVKGLPKTPDYIIDAAVELQFGEGV